ncbi:MAG TPA: hypothetical protein VK614_05175 [Allosphingosinicella sp.]|nr:hypothetical protein [Allosphingosinicella sp.]
MRFHHPDQWRAFIDSLSLDPDVPSSVSAKYFRAQKLYLIGWIDLDLVKAGELAALVALEVALRDRYGKEVALKDRRGQMPFRSLLKHMVGSDGLTDTRIPMIVRWGGTAIGFVDGSARPGLAEIRNAAAHGDPFDGFPIGGLLELVRDLIEYAYRHYLAEARLIASPPSLNSPQTN